MNTNWKLVTTALASMGIGVIGGTWLHAQTAAPPAFVVSHVDVSDQDTFKQYLAALPATLAPYKVKTLARGNPVKLDASTPPAGSLVILAFSNMADVKAWWNSPAYQAIIPLREKSSKTIAYAVEGPAAP
jgi:uncharacterized protein (DUF1330 family)